MFFQYEISNELLQKVYDHFFRTVEKASCICKFCSIKQPSVEDRDWYDRNSVANQHFTLEFWKNLRFYGEKYSAYRQNRLLLDRDSLEQVCQESHRLASTLA